MIVLYLNANLNARKIGRAFHKTKWEEKISICDSSRLSFYKQLKTDMSTANYTSLPYYRRKIIAKMRCSSHNLEIEKGGHKEQTRQLRYCLLCQERAIEDETHFLSSCQIYNTIRRTHGYATKSPQDIMNNDNQNNLSIFLSKCFRLREKMLKPK